MFEMFAFCIMICQVEIQVRKMYCVNRAVANLQFNFEDATHSEEDMQRAKEVCNVLSLNHAKL